MPYFDVKEILSTSIKTNAKEIEREEQYDKQRHE